MELIEKWKQTNEKWKQIESFKTKDEKIKEYHLLIIILSSGIAALGVLAALLLLKAPYMYQLLLPCSVMAPFGVYSLIKLNKIDMAAIERYKAAQNNL